VYVSVGNHDSGAGNRYEVKEAINHGCYNPITVNYDIALLYVEEDLTANGMAAAIPWNTNPVGSDGALWSLPMVVSGWGNMNNDPNAADSYPTILQTTTVETISNEECNGYGQYQGGITPVMFCADGTTASGMRTDSCQGDSGGPLVTAGTADGQPMSPMLFGVVSFGIGCATTLAGVYADVAMFDLWIQEHLNGQYKEEGHVLATSECEYGMAAPSPSPPVYHVDDMVPCYDSDDASSCYESETIVAAIAENGAGYEAIGSYVPACVPKSGCFGSPYWLTYAVGVDFVAGAQSDCKCHESCNACLYEESFSCISCSGEFDVIPFYSEGDGTCGSPPCFDDEAKVALWFPASATQAALTCLDLSNYGGCFDDTAVGHAEHLGIIVYLCPKTCGTCTPAEGERRKLFGDMTQHVEHTCVIVWEAFN